MSEPKANTIVKVVARPKVPADFPWPCDSSVNSSKLGIVIQGPYCSEDGFTGETAIFYRKRYPEIKIVISTWDDEKIPPDHIQVFERMGIALRCNRKPPTAGLGNINYQVESVRQGLHALKALGVEYVLRSRTDMRVCSPHALSHLMFLLRRFPLSEKNSPQKFRLIGQSMTSLLYRHYQFSDVLTFGHIDDQLLYWDPPYQPREADDEFRRLVAQARTNRDFSSLRGSEAYLMCSFMQKVGHEPLWTLADFWQVLAERFCIIDRETLDLLWIKYGMAHSRDLPFGLLREPAREIRHLDWQMMQQGDQTSFQGEKLTDESLW